MEKKKIQLSDHFTYQRLLRFVAPSALMFIFISIYGVVDGLFVSRYAGKVAFAGVNFIMPLVFLLATPGFMIGTGGSALVAISLGEGDRERANRLFSLFCRVSIVLGIVISVVAFLLMPTLARAMGADDAMLPYCVLYGRICAIGCMPQFLHFLFESFIVTAEKPELGLKFTALSGVTNIILDAVFVGWLQWGVAGAAAATVIGQCLGGFAPLIYFWRPNSSLLRITKTEFDGKALLRACTNGSSELMSNLSMSLVNMLYNVQLMKYFGENGVAAYGVMMYVHMIFIGLFIGYAVGTAPIFGYHFGAGDRQELHGLLKKSFVLLAAGGLLMLIAGQALAIPLGKLYTGYDPKLYEITVSGFRIFCVSFLFSGFAIFGSSFFTALGDGVTSAIISFLRTLVFQVAAVLILPLLFGPDGVWYSIVAAEVMAVLITATFFLAKQKKYGY